MAPVTVGLYALAWWVEWNLLGINEQARTVEGFLP